MLNWENRPQEIANLLNPAFCSLVIRECTRGYCLKRPEGLPHPMTFIVLPLVLHKATRQSLPRSSTALFQVWLHRNMHIQIGLRERIVHLIPVTREALMFGLQHNSFKITSIGTLEASGKRKVPKSWPRDSESMICASRAYTLGRLLAEAGNLPTIFALLGIRP